MPASDFGNAWTHYRAIDEAGAPCLTEGGGCSSYGVNIALHGLILRSYPRRQRVFELQLLDAHDKEIGRFCVQNPAQRNFPVWKPFPIPATQTNSSVVLTLRSLQWIEKDLSINAAAQWSTASDDPAWQNDLQVRYTFFDATGNEGSFLSVREPAWKARFQVYRDALASFRSTEQLAVTNLAVPGEASFKNIDRAGAFDDVELKVLVLAGAGRLNITNGVTRAMSKYVPNSGGHGSVSGSFGFVDYWTSAQPFVLIGASNLAPDDEVLAFIVDSHGNAKKAQLSWSSGQNGRRTGTVGLESLAQGATFDLRMVVSRPLSFEFMVDPKQVSGRAPVVSKK